MKLIRLTRSDNADKKWDVFIQDNEGKQHKVSFGAKGYQDFTQHHDEVRKNLYMQRHRANEDWSDPLTAGFWSRWLLWNKPSIRASLADVRRRFNL